MYPKKFNELVEALEMLPGVGGKTAQRYAFSLLDREKEDIDKLVESLNALKKIQRCKVCGFLSDELRCFQVPPHLIQSIRYQIPVLPSATRCF